MSGYCRPLYDNRLADHFVESILEIPRTSLEFAKAINRIVSAEIQNEQINRYSTMYQNNYRHHQYIQDQQRKLLRKEIFTELISQMRLEDDDHIKLGEGGALPRNGVVKTEKKALIIIGLPASGKSGIATKIAENYGAIILDSDYAKRKLPEFDCDFGASLVHDESNEIVFGSNKDSEYNCLDYCISQDFNIVVPKIGHSYIKILNFVKELKTFHYECHLILVSLDRKIATQRAYNRFLESKRYVPLSLIFDGYSNEPILTYYRLKFNDNFVSFGKLSSEKYPPKVIEYSSNSPVTCFL